MELKKNAIIIYARTTSTRLPNKALLQIGGYRLIELVINRVKEINTSSDFKIILATTKNPSDDILEQVSKENAINIFRGDELDVVKRTKDLIEEHSIKNFCRVNGDCPFVDIPLILEGFKQLEQGYDFVTNIKERTFPYGIAVECINSILYLKKASEVLDIEKEHVTKHLYRTIDSIKHYNIKNSIDESNFSLTIDTQEDLNYIQILTKKIPQNQLKTISYKSILKLNNNDNNF